MKVEITNDMWEHSQKFEHVGVVHQPSVHAGMCDMCHYLFRFICSWFNQRRPSTTFHVRSPGDERHPTKMDTNFNFLLTEGGAVHVHGCN